MLVPGSSLSMTFYATMLNTDVQLAPSNTIYWFITFFLYAQVLMQEKLQLLKNVQVPKVSCLMVMGN